jgi:RimJ/RimL family protein N-acetyltransferase
LDIIFGRRVYLRSLQPSDVQAFYTWYSDKDITKRLGIRPVSSEKAVKMLEQSRDERHSIYLGIVKKADEKLIGYVCLASIARTHRVAREFGIVIGDQTLWGQGYGYEAAKLVLEYGFHRLNLHRIELQVLDFNDHAIHLYRKLGFIEEGVKRKAHILDREWHNIITMGMLKHELR